MCQLIASFTPVCSGTQPACFCGSGFFIVFMYIVVLPAPTIYSFFVEGKNDSTDNTDDGIEGFFANPMQDGGEGGDAGQSLRKLPGNKVAKLQREGKEQRATIHSLTAKNDALQNEIRRLGGEMTAVVNSAAGAETAAIALSNAEAESHRFDTRRPSQILAIKGLVEEGILSEESVVEAKQAFEDHVGTQVQSQRDKNDTIRWA